MMTGSGAFSDSRISTPPISASRPPQNGRLRRQVRKRRRVRRNQPSLGGTPSSAVVSVILDLCVLAESAGRAPPGPLNRTAGQPHRRRRRLQATHPPPVAASPLWRLTLRGCHPGGPVNGVAPPGLPGGATVGL